jgi:hypothetical protein
MISVPTKTRGILSSGLQGGNKRENCTKWDFELGSELNMFADLKHATCGHITQNPLNMEHENGRECIDEHLLARLAEARLI